MQTQFPETWIDIITSPVDHLELYANGTYRLAGRTFGIYDPIPGITVGKVRFEKTIGIGKTLHITTPDRSVSIIFSGDRWMQLLNDEPFDQLNCTPSSNSRNRVQQVTSKPIPPKPKKASFRWLNHLVLTTFLTLGVLGYFHFIQQNGKFLLEEQGTSHEALQNGKYAALLVNSFTNVNLAECIIWCIGILLFGYLVERNAKLAKTFCLIACGAAGGVAGYWLFNTPEGTVHVDGVLTRIYWWIFQHHGVDAALGYADLVQSSRGHFHWTGPIAGSAGICGALIAYAVVRRKIYSNDVTVRPVKLILAVGFLAAVMFWAWPTFVKNSFPNCFFAGGFAAGIAFIFPEKVWRYASRKVLEQIRESRE